MYFSVCIPVFNAESYIANTLKSIELAVSDKTCIEVIIFDDGSTDNSLNICNDFKRSSDLKVKIIESHNVGRSKARNEAVAHSNGEFIVFLDADDTVNKGYFESLKSAITVEKANFIVSQVNFIDQSGKLIRKQLSYRNDYTLNENILVGNLPYTSAICIEKKIFLNIGGFKDYFEEREDWVFSAMAILNSKVKSYLLENSFVNVRYHQSNNSKNNSKFLDFTLKAINVIGDVNGLNRKKIRYKLMLNNIKHFSNRRVDIKTKYNALILVLTSYPYFSILSFYEFKTIMIAVFKIMTVNYNVK